jgi:hypothetical protein
MICSVWCRADMNFGQRQPLHERGDTTSMKITQGQASFYYGELRVVERHYRVRMHARNTGFPCSAIRAEDVRRRMAQVVSMIQSVLKILYRLG